MLRILLATPVPPPEHGGIINWTRVVRRELGDRNDLELSFVDTARRYEGIPGLPKLSRLLFGSRQALGVIYRLFCSMRSLRPDVLHLNTSGSYGAIRDILILYLAKILNIPSVIHYHLQRAPAEITGYLHWKLLRWAMSLAEAVVVLDKRSETRVRTALPGKKVYILPTMVEIDVIDELIRKTSTQPSAPNPVAKIVFVGFVTPVKGVLELGKACLKISDRNFVLDMIGKVSDTRLKQELEALADQAGMADRLRFHGAVDHAEVIKNIMAADLFVLPSHAESAPAVIIEAMGCGKPVVSTTTGAIPEMLDIGGPQECGVCVPPRNVDALAEAIARLLDHPEERMALGRKGRRRAEQCYAVSIGCSQLMDLWRSISRIGKLSAGE